MFYPASVRGAVAVDPGRHRVCVAAGAPAVQRRAAGHGRRHRRSTGGGAQPMTVDAGAAVTADIVPGFDQLAAEREQWDLLFAARAHEPSVSFEWTRAMVRHHVRPDDQCLLLRLHRQGAVVGLVPLVIRTVPLLGWHIRMLMPVSEDYNTHSDLLLRDTAPDVIRAFVAALAPSRDSMGLLAAGPAAGRWRPCPGTGRRAGGRGPTARPSRRRACLHPVAAGDLSEDISPTDRRSSGTI